MHGASFSERRSSLSHIVTIETKIHDPAAVRAACQRLHLTPAVMGSANLYSGEATGLVLHLPGWEYPVVIDPLTGTITYDNFNGAWGDAGQLQRFRQAYAVEKAKLEASKRGHLVSEEQLQDGSIKLCIRESY
jgi:hypothetical protein